MRFPISFNLPSKIVLGLIGAGPSRSYVEVTPDMAKATMGWAGNVSVKREDIATVEYDVSVPWWMGMGVHAIPGTVAMNGALGRAVKITTKRGTSARGRVLFVPIRPRTVYISVEAPAELAYELGFGPR